MLLSACLYNYQTLCHLKLINEAIAPLIVALNRDQGYKTFLSLPLSAVHGGHSPWRQSSGKQIVFQHTSTSGMSHFMGTSVYQLTPSVQHANCKFSHKHCLEAHHKKLAGSDLYPCILYMRYSALHAAVTFDDCSKLKLGQNSDFPEAVYCNKCHALCSYAKIWDLHISGTV